MQTAILLSVSDLNRLAREVLESHFPLLWVAGEISNLTRAASGHWYFSLKDDRAQVRCVMFRNKNLTVDWQPKEGDHVEARVLVSLYEPRGEFQLNVEALRPAGLGALFEAFEQLKTKLAAEGLFDPAKKRPLPPYPEQVGIVTSPDAAALRDVLTTLKRRMPGISVVIYPTPVQGKGAAMHIAQAIRTASARAECDVLVICRGGGSLEDLWSFNEEEVARAVATSSMPVVSGIGHETDFTITDFSADVRAPTPTAAAELVSPDRRAVSLQVEEWGRRIRQQILLGLRQRMQQVDFLARRLTHPREALSRQSERLAQQQARLATAAHHVLERAVLRCSVLQGRLQSATDYSFSLRGETLQRLEQSLHHLGPQAVLDRGYSLAQRADGHIVHSSRDVLPGEKLRLRFAQGQAETRIISTGD